MQKSQSLQSVHIQQVLDICQLRFLCQGGWCFLQGEILGDATRQLTDMVSQHSSWLRENCDRQVRQYRSFADARMQQLAASSASILHPQNRSRTAKASSLGSSASQDASSGAAASSDARKQWRSSHSLLSSQDEAAVTQAVTLVVQQQETALQVGHTLLVCIPICCDNTHLLP